MEQFSKENQDNKLLERAYRNKAQQNQVLVAWSTQQNQALATKAKTSAEVKGTKAVKVMKSAFRKQTADSDKTTQATVKAISASHMAGLETDSES